MFHIYFFNFSDGQIFLPGVKERGNNNEKKKYTFSASPFSQIFILVALAVSNWGGGGAADLNKTQL